MPHETVTLRTCDLIGAALDWAVFCAAYPGCEPTINVVKETTVERKPFINPFTSPRNVYLTYSGAYGAEYDWSPSTDWSQGGPLIEIYKLDLGAPMEATLGPWNANTEWGHPLGQKGETPLIAACRAIVSAHLGDSVDVPAELVGGGHE